ncbi:MAG: RluA family pseudouridine synthase [Saprospiraceae bacterium]
MKKLESHIVPEKTEEQRLSDYVVGIFETITSKKGMKKAITSGRVKINGEVGHTANYIRGGECIELFESKLKKTVKINLNLNVVYEDEYLAIVHKPAGIVVSGNKKRTILNALSSNLNQSSIIDKLPRPEPIHRLDHPTSGALLIGKTRKAVTALNLLFEHRKIEKTYHAITIGKMKKKGTIESAIKEKGAATHFQVIDKIKSDKYNGLNLVELKPITGRRHQLRIHMSELGNQILGDMEYGKEKFKSKGSGLFLHASSLKFTHPFEEKELDIKIELPQKFTKIFPEKE